MSQIEWKWHSDDLFEIGDSVPVGYAFKTDPLALILMEKDAGKANHEIGYSLKLMNTVILNKQSFAKDALKIRKYYRNKLMMLSLKGVKLSKFRQDLYDFLEQENVYYIREDFIPMLVKLPEFYAEDTMYDRFRKSCKTDPDFYDSRRGAIGVSLTLYPLENCRRKVRNSDQINYYFTDEDRHLYHIALDPRNPCLHLFEREFRKSMITLVSNVFGHRVKGTELGYFHLEGWEIL